jgi:hypothetical protein
MRQKFLDHEAVHFIAGRIFSHGGKTYYPGEPVDDARDWKNLETSVRSRYLVAVTEDVDVLPPQIKKDVKSIDFAMYKLRADHYLPSIQARDTRQAELAKSFDPGEHTIAEIRNHLETYPDEAEQVLEREKQGKNRVRLVTELEEQLTAPEEPIDV